MPKPVAVLTADLHLDVNNWAAFPDLAGDSLDAFGEIVALALARNVPIIAAGDVFDKPKNNAHVVGSTNYLLAELGKAGLKLYFVEGQHDRQTHEPWLSTLNPDVCKWLDNAVEPVGPFQVAGLDWRIRKDLVPALLDRQADRPDLLVLHQVFDEFMGSVAAAELTAEDLRGFSDVLLGDYHVNRIFEKDGLRVISPGSTNMRAINEPHEKFVFVLHDDKSLEKVKLNTRPFISWTISSQAMLEQFERGILDEIMVKMSDTSVNIEIRKPFLLLKYDPALPDIYNRLKRAVGSNAHLFFREIEGARVRSVEEAAARAEVAAYSQSFEESGLLGCLNQLVDRNADPSLADLCEALLARPDEPEIVLQEMEKSLCL